MVFCLILTINFILPKIKSGLKTFPRELVENVSIWTSVELVYDVGLMFVCLPIYSRYWFQNGTGIIREMFEKWLKTMRGILMIGFSVVSVFVFFIVFFVVLDEPDSR